MNNEEIARLFATGVFEYSEGNKNNGMYIIDNCLYSSMGKYCIARLEEGVYLLNNTDSGNPTVEQEKELVLQTLTENRIESIVCIGNPLSVSGAIDELKTIFASLTSRYASHNDIDSRLSILLEMRAVCNVAHFAPVLAWCSPSLVKSFKSSHSSIINILDSEASFIEAYTKGDRYTGHIFDSYE